MDYKIIIQFTSLWMNSTRKFNLQFFITILLLFAAVSNSYKILIRLRYIWSHFHVFHYCNNLFRYQHYLYHVMQVSYTLMKRNWDERRLTCHICNMKKNMLTDIICLKLPIHICAMHSINFNFILLLLYENAVPFYICYAILTKEIFFFILHNQF
jgi:hypothetical protein